MKYLFFTLLSLFTFSSFAQDTPDPISWAYEVVDAEDSNKTIIITATIEKDWKLYSQHTEEGGPVPTSFSFDTEGIELIGDVKETSKAKTSFSEMFDINVTQFSDTAIFKQNFKTNGAKSIKGEVYYMTCDGLRCLPPKPVNFEIEL